jgi:hypothetical protein
MGKLLTTASLLQCPHGGSVIITTSNTKTRAAGAYVVRKDDTFSIAGCAFTLPSGTPHPCTRVDWLSSTLRVGVTQGDALAEDSVGLCLAADGAPQGSVLVSSTQARAKGM